MPGRAKRPEHAARDVSWNIAIKRGIGDRQENPARAIADLTVSRAA
jgi:hypothetical protein